MALYQLSGAYKHNDKRFEPFQMSKGSLESDTLDPGNNTMPVQIGDVMDN